LAQKYGWWAKMSLLKNRKYTYEDYLAWDDEKRWELFNGTAYAMSSPSADHQEIVGKLLLFFLLHLEGKTCKIFVAPYDVRLEDDTIVQPDLSLVCDAGKRAKGGCVGAPDMVIEVTSPATRDREFNKKQWLYKNAGVKEYWIVNPEINVVQVKRLDEKGNL
jgi:Uma2 family endonuclease